MAREPKLRWASSMNRLVFSSGRSRSAGAPKDSAGTIRLDRYETTSRNDQRDRRDRPRPRRHRPHRRLNHAGLLSWRTDAGSSLWLRGAALVFDGERGGQILSPWKDFEGGTIRRAAGAGPHRAADERIRVAAFAQNGGDIGPRNFREVAPASLDRVLNRRQSDARGGCAGRGVLVARRDSVSGFFRNVSRRASNPRARRRQRPRIVAAMCHHCECLGGERAGGDRATQERPAFRRAKIEQCVGRIRSGTALEINVERDAMTSKYSPETCALSSVRQGPIRENCDAMRF